MSVCIVTGSGGLIGSESVRFFSKKFDVVVGIDNDSRSYFFGKDASVSDSINSLTYIENYVHHPCDIRDYGALEKIFSKFSNEIELVIHTAAQPSHDWAAKEPLTDFSINAMGTLNLLELTRLHSPKASFIFTSTNKVYGDSPNKLLGIHEDETRYQLYNDIGWKQSIDESMSIDNSMHSVFGASKVAADVMVQEYGKYFNMNTVCFRGGCLTGPQHKGAQLHGFLSYIIKCIVSGKQYTIFGYKGKQVRDNIHSWDLINMFDCYHSKPRQGEVYNAGGGMNNSVSVLETINLVNDVCREIDPSWVDWKNYTISETPRMGDHIYYVTNLWKFMNHYPEWNGITIPIRDIVKEMVLKELNNE